MINQKKVHKLLFEFNIHAKIQLPILFENILLLREYIPRDIKNPILLFLLPRAINGILEKQIVATEQAWRLVNRTLKEFKETPLDKGDQDYKDLDYMRDKLIAHFIDSSLSQEEDRHWEWYKRKYGTYVKTFVLIQRVNNKICSKIDWLEQQGKLVVKYAKIKLSKKIDPEDIAKLLNALKGSNIY